MRILLHETLATHTTLGIGGPARVWCEASPAEVPDAFDLADSLRLPVSVIGDGSNVLVSDSGIDELVLRVTQDPGADIISVTPGRLADDPVEVCVAASADWDSFVRHCVANRWQGLECLSGIPGTVGAAPVQNIGAYGQQVSDVITSVTAFDTEDESVRTLDASACGFGYRASTFNHGEDRDRYVIMDITVRLHPNGVPQRTQRDVIEATTAISTLHDVRHAVLRVRHRKGMLRGDVASAGSFFKNPVVSRAVGDAVIAAIGGEHWYWQTGDGDVKLSAARLIEAAGFVRGFTVGRVGISPLHALALINLGGATADELCALARKIQETVGRRFGVTLSPEVQLLGFDGRPLLD